MGNTSRYGWPYPEVSDPPNTSLHLNNLAQAAETTLGTIDDRYPAQPRGRVTSGTRTSVSANITAEAVVDTLTATLVINRRYRFVFAGSMVAVSGVGTYTTRVRYASGGTLTTAGTLAGIPTITSVDNLGNFEPRFYHEAEFVAPSSGTFTVGWTLQPNAGTIRSDGGWTFRLDDIGL